MTTKKQMAANRRNAAKSTGPRTRAGKDVSALNAQTHGVFTKRSVTMFESYASGEHRLAAIARLVMIGR